MASVRIPTPVQRLFVQYFRCFLHQLRNRQMPRTYTFALAAVDTIGSLTAPADQPGIKVLGTPVIRISSEGIDRTEHIRNDDLHRAAVHTVLAGGTTDLRYTEQFRGHLLDDGLLVLRQRLKIRKCADIIILTWTAITNDSRLGGLN